MIEAFLNSSITIVTAIFVFPQLKMLTKFFQQCLFVHIVPTIQVHVKNRILRPLLLQPLQGQPLEQIFLTREISLQGRDQKALAETTGTAEEIITSLIDKFVNKCCLVYIHIAVVTEAFKILYTYWIFHICLLL